MMSDGRPSGLGLGSKLLAASVVSIAGMAIVGAAGWIMLHSARDEIVDASLSGRVELAGWLLGLGVLLGMFFLAGAYFYFVRSVVRPLQANARLVTRLAGGDCGVEVDGQHLARSDEVGDMARSIRDAAAYQQRESDIANRVAAGDFSAVRPVRSPDDAFGTALRRMAGVAFEAVRHADSQSRLTADGCNSILAAGGELSANSAGIAQAVKDISSGIDSFGERAVVNADMAKQAGQLADSGGQSIERGYEDIGEMGVVMLEMQSSGDKIVRIAKSIGDIAFQTNLLALNASVEAARAGRHGKGFTIVAEEVRSLAVRTRKAAEETSTLMQETVRQVELAAAIAGRINAMFGDMQTNVQEAEALMAKIALASDEQNVGIKQVADVLRRAEQSAQQNMQHIGAIMEEVDRLAGQAARLDQTHGPVSLDTYAPPHLGFTERQQGEYDDAL